MTLGRLFWKFFAFIWLAQLAGIIAIASTFWFTDPRIGEPREMVFQGGPPPLGPLHGPGPGWAPRAPRGAPPLLPTLATLLASLATAFALAWYVAKPIRSLRAAFDAVAAGNLAARVAPSLGSRHDELADLGTDFDRMAGRLQASMNGQRRLLHDVSHEVRSPLARLQAAAGLLRQRYGTGEPAIERMEEEIVRIDRLVDGLLHLSRLEAGDWGSPEEKIQMSDLVREVVDDARFEALPLGHTVTWVAEASGVVSGHAEMLHGALENVIRNALKHAPESPEILVETALDARRNLYIVTVLDSGPGVPEAELCHLFTPFFRAGEASRTDGHGLGLAIARRSIEAHGGTICASNRPAGGLAVVLTLPLLGAAGSADAPGVH